MDASRREKEIFLVIHAIITQSICFMYLVVGCFMILRMQESSGQRRRSTKRRKTSSLAEDGDTNDCQDEPSSQVPLPTPADEDDEESVSQSGTSVESTGRSNPKKRRRTQEAAADRMVEIIDRFCDRMCIRLEEIALRIGYKTDIAKKRGALFDALGKLPGLEIEDRLIMASKLADEELDIFFSLPDHARLAMVRMKLEGRI